MEVNNAISLAGGFNLFFGIFSPRNLGEMIQLDEHIFQMGWFNHQLVISAWCVSLFRAKHRSYMAIFPDPNGSEQMRNWLGVEHQPDILYYRTLYSPLFSK